MNNGERAPRVGRRRVERNERLDAASPLGRGIVVTRRKPRRAQADYCPDTRQVICCGLARLEIQPLHL